MKIKPSLRDYFYFTKTERFGILVLSTVLFLLLLSPSLYKWIIHPKEMESLYNDPVLVFDAPQPTQAKDERLFFFDPNTATESELIHLGIPPKTASSIIKYRQKGGIFKKKEDLARIYNLKEADYLRLYPWIHFPSNNSQADSKGSFTTPNDTATIHPINPNNATEEQLKQVGISAQTRKAWINYLAKGGSFKRIEEIKKLYPLTDADYLKIFPHLHIPPKEVNRPSELIIKSIEINTATYEQWVSLPSIGRSWAGKIMRFKEKLGGFTQISQVAETFGLPDSVYQKIVPLLNLKETKPSTVPLNTASFDQLNQHPYINAQQAKWIIAYRQQHGTVERVEDLLKIPTLNANWFEKTKPYLSL